MASLHSIGTAMPVPASGEVTGMAFIKLPDAEIRDLRDQGFENEEILVWLTMLCLASRETGKHRGMLLVHRRPAKPREIAAEARTDLSVVESTIKKALSWDRLVERAVPGTGEIGLEIAYWDRMQLDRTAAARKERERAKKEAEGDAAPADGPID
jgi:hypothetical protein